MVRQRPRSVRMAKANCPMLPPDGGTISTSIIRHTLLWQGSLENSFIPFDELSTVSKKEIVPRQAGEKIAAPDTVVVISPL